MAFFSPQEVSGVVRALVVFQVLWKLALAMCRTVASNRYRPISLPLNAEYRPEEDVTVVVPTIDFTYQIVASIRTLLSNRPKEVILVTTAALYSGLVDLLEDNLSLTDNAKIQVLHVGCANKRRQLAEGIRHATGRLIVVADDDVFWSPTVLTYLLAGFENNVSVGGVGSFQVVRGSRDLQMAATFSVWEALAARRLFVLNRGKAAHSYMDNGVMCLSGRTACYRASILQKADFLYAFTNEYWLGRFLLNSGDDQFLTTWLLHYGWQIRIQSASEAEVETTALRSAVFIRQLLRWKRGSQRSAIKRLLFSPRLWRNHPLLSLIMAKNLVEACIWPVISLWQVQFLCELWSTNAEHGSFAAVSSSHERNMLLALFALPSILGHAQFCFNNPWFLKHLAAQIVIGWWDKTLMSTYTLATLHNTAWLSRNI